MDLAQANAPKAGVPQPVAHLERLPKVLVEPLITEQTKGKVVQIMVGVTGGVLPRLVDGLTGRQSPIDKQHRVIMDRVHGRRDGEKMTARPGRRTSLTHAR